MAIFDFQMGNITFLKYNLPILDNICISHNETRICIVVPTPLQLEWWPS